MYSCTVVSGIHDFVKVEQARKSIFPGKTLKRYVLKQDLSKGKATQTTSEQTLDGNTGMLVNGVEITNYKSDRYIYYGPLKALDLVNSGTGYDVLYPPSISIENSSTGINTAFGRIAIGGTVVDVLIDPVDFEIKKVVSGNQMLSKIKNPPHSILLNVPRFTHCSNSVSYTHLTLPTSDLV